MPGKSFSRGVRKVHIMQIFIKNYKEEKPAELTSSQVARALMLEPSFHMRGLLAELVRDGELSVRQVYDNRGKNLKIGQGKDAPRSDGAMYYFSLSDKSRKKIEDDAREIPVNVGGKSVGQLRLF